MISNSLLITHFTGCSTSRTTFPHCEHGTVTANDFEMMIGPNQEEEEYFYVGYYNSLANSFRSVSILASGLCSVEFFRSNINVCTNGDFMVYCTKTV